MTILGTQSEPEETRLMASVQKSKMNNLENSSDYPEASSPMLASEGKCDPHDTAGTIACTDFAHRCWFTLSPD